MCPVRCVTYVSGRSKSLARDFWFFVYSAVVNFVDALAFVGPRRRTSDPRFRNPTNDISAYGLHGNRSPQR
jgi:hypothetical protein